jgi:hybrid cluster-associated redox disulfide protein
MEKQQGAGEKSRRYLSAKSPKAKAAGESPKNAKAAAIKSAKAEAPKLITRETNILELVHEYPEAVPVLIEAGLHCIGCQLSMFDTIEQGCAIHGMEEETVDKLVKEMNERVKGFRK